MIDTIVLTIPSTEFRITDPEKFSPNARWVYSPTVNVGHQGYIKSLQNASTSDKKLGIYRPRLTVTKRITNEGLQITLKVEFSAPKLLFGNNFTELVEQDFGQLVTVLHQNLISMGVSITPPTIRKCTVSAIHYAKNVPLTDGSTTFSILKEIQKSNITQRLDSNQTDYRNEGHSFKFRCNSYEVAFYDKIRDLQFAADSEKRAVENDNYMQLGLFDNATQRKSKKFWEVLRVEIRLNQRQKIKALLKGLKYKIEPTFEDLFNLGLAQNILIHYLDQIEDNIPQTTLFVETSYKDLLANIIINNPHAKITDIFAVLGFHKTLKQLTVREVRALLRGKSQGTWYKFFKKMNGFDIPRNRGSPLDPIRQSIINYLPLKLDEYIIDS